VVRGGRNQWETGDGGRPRCGMTRVERLAWWGGGPVVWRWRGHVGGAGGGVPWEKRGRSVEGRKAGVDFDPLYLCIKVLLICHLIEI
jgi:hypothetical protein